MTTVMTRAVARVLFLPILIAAVAVLVKGYASPGDGFSAGVIAAVGVLVQYVAFGYRAAERLLPVHFARFVAAVGLLLCLTVAFAPVLWGRALMTHSPPPGEEAAHLGALELTTAFLFDVGVFLLVVSFSVGVISVIAHTIESRER